MQKLPVFLFSGWCQTEVTKCNLLRVNNLTFFSSSYSSAEAISLPNQQSNWGDGEGDDYSASS